MHQTNIGLDLLFCYKSERSKTIGNYPGQVYAIRDLRLDRFHSSVPPQNAPIPCLRFTPLPPPVLDAEHGQVVVLLRPSRKQVHGRADVFEDLLGMGTWL